MSFCRNSLQLLSDWIWCNAQCISMHLEKRILIFHFMLVFKNSSVFRKVGKDPILLWSLKAFLRGGYFWVFEPMFHLVYLIKMHISFNNSILCRVPQVLRLKYGVLYWSSVVKTLKPWGTLPKIKLKAFLSVWFRPGSNRWPSAYERKTLCNDLKFLSKLFVFRRSVVDSRHAQSLRVCS